MSMWAYSIGTSIGWIVDITTLGATIIYGLASYAVFKDAKNSGTQLEKTTGMVGLVLMLAFALMFLLPHFFSFSSMASKSYILFDLWAILGLLYFRRLVSKDSERKYGHSVLVWFMLLLFVLFTSMMWVSEATKTVTGSDEFAVILETDDYEQRYELMEKINNQAVADCETAGSTIAAGISDYIKGKDTSVLEVFTRADYMMYERKAAMKNS